MAFHLDNLHQGLQQLSWGNLKETKEHVDFLIKYLESSNETNNMLESKIARCIRYGILNLETLSMFLKHNIVNFTKLDLFSKELLQTLQKGLQVYLRVLNLKEQFIKPLDVSQKK